MKTLSFIRIICCALILIPVYLPGKGVAGGPGNGGMRNGGTGPGPSAGATGDRAQGAGGISSPEGLSTLDQFLSLDDEALEQLEATVRRIRQMSPGERRSLREQIARYRQMPEAEKRTLQSSWGRLDRDVRGAWKWSGDYFCRNLYWGSMELGSNCQAVRRNGGTLRFISDQGAGRQADLYLE